jgi:hypothetical protein
MKKGGSAIAGPLFCFVVGWCFCWGFGEMRWLVVVFLW